MKRFVLLTAVLLSIVLSSNAQYALMTKGERNPFDSAVAIRIDVYRTETLKMELADELIDNLNLQVRDYDKMVSSLSHRISLSDSILLVKDEIIRNKQLTINALLEKVEYKPTKNWWEKNSKPILFISGLSVGITGAILVVGALK